MFGLTLVVSFATAQTESTIAASDIVYWVGEGDASAIFVIEHGDGAVAWGYRFDPAAGETVEEMATAISDADPRMFYGWGMLAYTEYPVHVEWDGYSETFRFKVDGVLADEDDLFADYDLADGMFVKVSGSDDDVWSATITPASVLYTPEDATIDPSRIAYWVGEGANSVVFAVNWGVPDTALAWGLRFDGEMTIDGVLRAVCAGDSRLSADNPLTSINYSDGTVSLSFSPSNSPLNMPQYILNGNGNVNATTAVTDGDFVKIGESLYGYGYDSIMGYAMGVVWPTTVHPVFRDATDATIAEADVRYWVGEGENKVRFVVNWADTSLAWGYKFATETVSMTTVMDDIKAADPRFDYVLADGFLSDITFNDGTVSLAITAGNYWEQHLNGVSGYGMGETLRDGDLNIWADPAAGVQVGEVDYGEYGVYPIYAYPMEIHPVSVPQNNGISDVESTALQVYPNPASDVLNVVCGPVERDARAALYDMSGRKVLGKTVNGDSLTFNTSTLANGVYILHVGDKNVKVVVRH